MTQLNELHISDTIERTTTSVTQLSYISVTQLNYIGLSCVGSTSVTQLNYTSVTQLPELHISDTIQLHRCRLCIGLASVTQLNYTYISDTKLNYIGVSCVGRSGISDTV